MTHQQAIDAGIIEPTHASAYHVFRNSWGEGVVNDDWVHELSYIALRDITLSYRMPKSIASKIGAKGLNLSLAARNVGYIYNSLPNNVHRKVFVVIDLQNSVSVVMNHILETIRLLLMPNSNA